MGLLVLVLLCATGCDRLLGLTVTPLGDGGAGGFDGMVGDTSVDAPPICAPTTAKVSANTYTTPMTEVALSEQAGYDIYQVSGNLDYETPIGKGATPVTFAVSASHPAVTRDGSEVFYSTGSEVVSASGLPGGTVQSVSELGNVDPGTPATLSTGQLAMVVASTTSPVMFQEWRRPLAGGMWTSNGSAFQPPGTASYPSLSADGLLLVYIDRIAQGAWGVHYYRRDRIDADWSSATQSASPLVSDLSNPIASPWISDDCKRLYIVRYTTGGLQQLDLQ